MILRRCSSRISFSLGEIPARDVFEVLGQIGELSQKQHRASLLAARCESLLHQRLADRETAGLVVGRDLRLLLFAESVLRPDPKPVQRAMLVAPFEILVRNSVVKNSETLFVERVPMRDYIREHSIKTVIAIDKEKTKCQPWQRFPRVRHQLTDTFFIFRTREKFRARRMRFRFDIDRINLAAGSGCGQEDGRARLVSSDLENISASCADCFPQERGLVESLPNNSTVPT